MDLFQSQPRHLREEHFTDSTRPSQMSIHLDDAFYSVCCNIYNLSLYLQKYVTVSVVSLYVSMCSEICSMSMLYNTISAIYLHMLQYLQFVYTYRSYSSAITIYNPQYVTTVAIN